MLRERDFDLVLIAQAVPDHEPHRNVDPPEAARAAQLAAAAKMLKRRLHPAAGIGGVAQAAERVGLELRIADLARDGEGFFVLGAAQDRLAAREMQVAAGEVDVAFLERKVARGKRRVGVGKGLHRLVDAAEDAQAGGHADPGAATTRVGRREVEHLATDVDRILRAAECAQRLGLLHRQVEPVPRAPRQLQAARG